MTLTTRRAMDGRLVQQETTELSHHLHSRIYSSPNFGDWRRPSLSRLYTNSPNGFLIQRAYSSVLTWRLPESDRIQLEPGLNEKTDHSDSCVFCFVSLSYRIVSGLGSSLSLSCALSLPKRTRPRRVFTSARATTELFRFSFYFHPIRLAC